LWWLGLILGVGCFLGMWWLSTTVPVHQGRVSQEDLMFGAIFGAVPIVIGWLCRYVLSGETKI
jgi:hypothetical protein